MRYIHIYVDCILTRHQRFGLVTLGGLAAAETPLVGLGGAAETLTGGLGAIPLDGLAAVTPLGDPIESGTTTGFCIRYKYFVPATPMK